MFVFAGASAAGAQRAPQETEGQRTFVPRNPATLLISGDVTVNNRKVWQQTSTVFAGDRIETAPGAVARVSAPGMSVYLPANSCLGYGGERLEMCNCGSIDVNAMKPLSVVYKARKLLISSTDTSAAFTMSVAGNDLELVTRNGSTSIAQNGSVISNLTAGVTRSFAGLGCAAPVTTVSSFSSRAGVAAAAAAPAAISAAVIKTESKRSPLSSTTP